jgi:hypothetical protein
MTSYLRTKLYSSYNSTRYSEEIKKTIRTKEGNKGVFFKTFKER